MGLIQFDQRRTRQPQTQALPAQRWFDRGLAIAVSGNNSWGKYAGGRLQPLVDTGIVSAGDAGLGKRYTSGSSQYGSYDAAWMKPKGGGSNGPTTLLCCYSMQSLTGTQRVVSLGYEAAGGGMMISPNGTQQRVIINSGGVNTISNVGGALVAGKTYVTACSIEGTSFLGYHSDNTTASNTGSVSWANTDFLRLATDEVLSSYANVTVFGVYVFETALAKSAIDELMGNFHAVWEPRRIWVPVSAGGGGTATVTPSIIASTASVGSHTVARTAVAAVTASRIEPTATIGTATVARSAVAAVAPSRIASTATIGAHVVSAAGLASVAPTRIASTVTFGAATVTRTAVAAVSPARIASTASIGAHVVTVAGMGAISAARIASTVSFGAATVTRSAVHSIQPGRIDSSVAFGVPVVTSSTPQIVVVRIASTAAVYAPTVVRTGPVVAASEYRRFSSAFVTSRTLASAITQTVTLASAIDLE